MTKLEKAAPPAPAEDPGLADLLKAAREQYAKNEADLPGFLAEQAKQDAVRAGKAPVATDLSSIYREHTVPARSGQALPTKKAPPPRKGK